MDTIEAVKQRRSINFFDPDFNISDDEIKKIIELATLTPSSMNLQPWNVIVVKSPDKKELLMKCAMNQKKIVEASCNLIIVANTDAVESNIDEVMKSWFSLGYLDEKTAEMYKGFAKNLYGEKDDLKRKLFAVKNASFFAMSIMIIAKGLGYDTHPMDGIDQDMIKKEFNIPEHHIIPVVIALGKIKSETKLLERAMRFPVDKISKFV